MWKIFSVCLLTVLSFLSFAETCTNDPSLGCNFSGPEIEIGEPLANSETRDVKKFFGVHAFYWSMQTDLYANTPSKVSPQAQSILKNSGVGFVRYGGGVNEIDWRTCVGWVMDRPKQKIVDWAGPIRCIFGLAEYEKLNDELGLDSSWHIANVVGFEGRTNPIESLANDAGERAKLIRELSGSRQRFWELGNELDRDRLRWSAEKISDRGLPIAHAIKKNDPSAHIIVPLLEYRPEWIGNVDDHNRYLIRQHKAVAHDYALHLYYDNAPWGPSVAARLATVRNVAKTIQSEGVSSPGIWVTEHARPPPGTPKDKDWTKNWYQTGNHDAVIATADFLIGLTQIPMAQGAAWHGVRTGPWNFIDVKAGDLYETRMSRLFELLTPTSKYQTLSTKSVAPHEPTISGGYAIRAAAFSDKTDSEKPTCIVWLVNRSTTEKNVRLTKESFKKLNTLEIKQINITESYEPSVQISRLPMMLQTQKPTSNGSVMVVLPKRSVVLLKIHPNE